MRTFYVIFNEDLTVDTSINKDFDPNQYTYIKTRVNDMGTLEYYAHNSLADFYEGVFVNGKL